MAPRMDEPFEMWGEFIESTEGSPKYHGRLTYHPDKGIELELVGYEVTHESMNQVKPEPANNFYGQLVDGRLITLFACDVTSSSIHIPSGIVAPTTFRVLYAIFGGHFREFDRVTLKEYSVELSSLSNWSCVKPVTLTTEKQPLRWELRCQRPADIVIALPKRNFDLAISHNIRMERKYSSSGFRWASVITVVAHNTLELSEAQESAWQFQSLLSLFVGSSVSQRSITAKCLDVSSPDSPKRDIEILFGQRLRATQEDVYPVMMPLPYPNVRECLGSIVENWFSRQKQAILATNIFFWAQNLESPSVEVKLLHMVQAAEAYHRSLGGGLYMSQEDYEAALKEFSAHMPGIIQGDHRQSLKSRLKWGNEFSLRTRLTEMFDRIPKEASVRIAGTVDHYIDRVVNTRNYYTHSDVASEKKAFNPKEAYVAAERLRILIVANLLKDLAIGDDQILPTLQRSPQMDHWMCQDLPV